MKHPTFKAPNAAKPMPMLNHWRGTEHLFEVPPLNKTVVVVSYGESGQFYTSVRDFDSRLQQFTHRSGSTLSHHALDGALKHAQEMWHEEKEMAEA